MKRSDTLRFLSPNETRNVIVVPEENFSVEERFRIPTRFLLVLGTVASRSYY